MLIHSNDVHVNPGPNNFNQVFSFCNWNCNSIVKNNFNRINLLKVQASIYHDDVMSLCETSLHDDVEIPETLIDGYNFMLLNHPSGNKHGGVGIFYKENLPGKRKVFYSVCYRSPSMKANTPEFENLLADFENLYRNISKNKPYACFFAGEFNAHSQHWWLNGDPNAEGFALDNLFPLDLSQLICEPSNFEENKSPSCIDLIISDQPNVVMESGVRSSTDNFCKHQMTFCNLNLHIPPPIYSRKLWNYNRANSDAMTKAVYEFP